MAQGDSDIFGLLKPKQIELDAFLQTTKDAATQVCLLLNEVKANRIPVVVGLAKLDAYIGSLDVQAQSAPSPSAAVLIAPMRTFCQEVRAAMCATLS